MLCLLKRYNTGLDSNFNRQDIEDLQDKTQYLRDTVDRLKTP